MNQNEFALCANVLIQEDWKWLRSNGGRRIGRWDDLVVYAFPNASLQAMMDALRERPARIHRAETTLHLMS